MSSNPYESPSTMSFEHSHRDELLTKWKSVLRAYTLVSRISAVPYWLLAALALLSSLSNLLTFPIQGHLVAVACTGFFVVLGLLQWRGNLAMSSFTALLCLIATGLSLFEIISDTMIGNVLNYRIGKVFLLSVLHLALFLPLYSAFEGWRLFWNGIVPSNGGTLRNR